METSRFILASASPRRVALLREASFLFSIEPADINEDDVPPGLSPRELAIHLAREKAAAVAKRHAGTGVVVLGADTVVAVGNDLFAKAQSPDEARAMLRRLSGTRQSVITGVAAVSAAGHLEKYGAAESVVEMKSLSEREIDDYVATDDWRGKAGAYGIQDHDPEHDPFVRLVSGSFDNVVGLPVDLATRLLGFFGIQPEG